MLSRILAGLMLCVIFTGPVAGQEENSKRQEILAVLERSGLSELINQLPQHIQAGMSDSLRDGNEAGIPPEDIVVISDIVQQSFASEAIMHDVVAHFEQHYDKARLASVMKQLETPLAERMMQLEVEAARPEAYQEMMKFAATLETDPPATPRLELLSDLDKKSHTTELTVALQVEIIQSIMRVMAAYAAEQGIPFATEEMEQTLDTMSGQVWDNAQYMTLVSYLYTYRQVSDADIREYTGMYQDTDMQWYLALSSSALINAMSRAMTNAGESITQHLNGTRRQS